MGIFRWIFGKREKPRVFLGTFVVVPRAGIKPHFDQSKDDEFDGALRSRLKEIFSLPPASGVPDPLPTDLGLDVFVPSFQSGDFRAGAPFAELGVPIFYIFFWRPKVTVTCRLYYLKSQQTSWTYSVTKKMPWREFFGRAFSAKGLIRFEPLISADDMNHLLQIACHSLLTKLAKAT